MSCCVACCSTRQIKGDLYVSVAKLIGPLFVLIAIMDHFSTYTILSQLRVCYRLWQLQQIVDTIYLFIHMSLLSLSRFWAAPVNLSKRPFWIMISWRIWIWRKYVKLSIACIPWSIQQRTWSSRREMSAALCTSWKVSVEKSLIDG